jgi:diphthamide synthase (EF-2-diphthine--ammonia ligase)
LDRKYLGREINGNFLIALEKEAVDVCGENGEYHSLVYDGPCFKKPLPYRICGVRKEMENIFLDIRSA